MLRHGATSASALACGAVSAATDRRRRTSFDGVAELYDAARPDYPDELVAALIELAGLREGKHVLEIGPGAGQLSVALARSGVVLTAVELGPSLAAIARRRLAGFPHAQVVVADFDHWPVPAGAFDLVVAATAFHWLDPATRVRRCTSALRPGGALAVVETHWGVGAADDAFFVASQSCYAQWDPAHDSAFEPRSASAPSDAHDELVATGLFAELRARRTLVDRAYDAKQYSDLLGTFSNVLGLDERHRDRLLACLSHLIDTQFAGSITRRDLYNLTIGYTGEQPAVAADGATRRR
ncbi:MAG: class I SAM-dependent methyltransferase [Deltaproteobacteria bacterium]|nr:class I SAM-dependent methyltransferase [Nannocystaceae bacterium]